MALTTRSPLPLLLLFCLPGIITGFLHPSPANYHATATTKASFLRLTALSGHLSTGRITSQHVTAAARGTTPSAPFTTSGAEFLTNERDACGVGFVADLKGNRNHQVLAKSLHALGCMEHRGACSADDVSIKDMPVEWCTRTISSGWIIPTSMCPNKQDSGDGAGVMTDIPWEILSDMVKPEERAHTGVGMVFLPQDPHEANQAKAIIEGDTFSLNPNSLHHTIYTHDMTLMCLLVAIIV